MKKTVIAIAATVAGFGFAAPAAMAQDAPINGTITIYGDDPCPENTICVRAPETERYRVPRTIRENQPIKREDAAWAARVEDVMDAGDTGIGSCSAVGPGGAVGCAAEEIRQGTAEARERADRATDLPLP
ncbi:hypothetical protein [Stakelama tenebrarum]|uniref:Uncharacterized protein n=1 Tax=Stakelama tenebrarum TaxID=2711215 RepID=A0A6G6Y0W9_9SPHN|nr:hypothetical protein [Sphingosinithalassobacter tenebrarum]QIG78457.1 hypothetical protein G5C33_00695 [Sphingosinithalassobacter tenebrarum]